jgi:MscS family membrane protein
MNRVSVDTLLVSLAIVAAGWMAAYLLFALFRWGARWADRSRFRIDGLLLRILGPPVGVLVALASVNYALYRIPEVRAAFDRWEGAQHAVFIVTGTWVLSSLVKTLLREYALPIAERTDTDVDERVVRILDLTAVYVIWSAGLLVALREVGVEVTAFLASLGIAGLAVALAAKTILSNVLTGVTLTADRNFRVGDRIQVRDYLGDVLAINLHKTIIRTRDNEIVMIPNDVLGREVIVNHMLPEEQTRIEMDVGVAYDTDLDRATAVLADILAGSERILDEPAPEVNVRALGDSAVMLQVLAWIDRPRRKRAVRDRVYREALRRFAAEGIEIPFPRRDVHVFGRLDTGAAGQAANGSPRRESGAGPALE